MAYRLVRVFELQTDFRQWFERNRWIWLRDQDTALGHKTFYRCSVSFIFKFVNFANDFDWCACRLMVHHILFGPAMIYQSLEHTHHGQEVRMTDNRRNDDDNNDQWRHRRRRSAQPSRRNVNSNLHRATSENAVNFVNDRDRQVLQGLKCDENKIPTCSCLTRWRGHKREVNKVIYKHAGSQHFVLSGSKDCSIKLWKFNETECIKTFKGHQFSVTGLAAIGENNFISGARDGKLFLWNIEHSDKPIISSNIFNNQNIITHIEIDNENQLIFQTAEDGTIKIWDINNLLLIDTINSTSFGCCYQPLWHCSKLINIETNSLLTSGGGDGNEIKHWDIRQRKLIQRFRGHENDVRAAIFLYPQPQITSKKLILSVSNDKTIRLWDVNNGKCIWTENSITSELNCCADFTNGRVIGYGLFKN